MGCNFTEPFDHSPPVHHGGVQLPAARLAGRVRVGTAAIGAVAAGQEPELHQYGLPGQPGKGVGQAGICSRCHRDIDRGLDEQMSELETRERDAADKLGRIRRLIAVTPDADLRPKLMSILDEK